MATVASAAMPPVTIEVSMYAGTFFLVKVNGKQTLYGVEDRSYVAEFVNHVVIGVEAAGRQVEIEGRDLTMGPAKVLCQDA